MRYLKKTNLKNVDSKKAVWEERILKKLYDILKTCFKRVTGTDSLEPPKLFHV